MKTYNQREKITYLCSNFKGELHNDIQNTKLFQQYFFH